MAPRLPRQSAHPRPPPITMKLATYQDGSRDGQLVVVSRDLSTAHYASGLATRLQQVLDDWNFLSPQLEDLSTTLNQGKARHAFPFDPRRCAAPLPRAFQRVEAAPALLGVGGDAGLTLRQHSGDDLCGPCAPIDGRHVGSGLDVAGGLAVITGDVAAGVSPAEALEGVRLVVLVADTCRREGDACAGDRLGCAFAPVAVTPDELGAAWQGGRVALNLEFTRNGKRLGLVDAAAGTTASFGTWVARLARLRPVHAGSIVASGELRAGDGSRGFASLAARRASELADLGAPRTDWLQPGDLLRFDIKGAEGQSVFGAIDRQVVLED